ncbi:transposase [Geofilum rubicundum]|uniref:transposase n=1 Tax=Geofilum rubicundum TaxID=472113 RepID=UPI000A021FA7|nr:transposase [Geofilum rubicundum]
MADQIYCTRANRAALKEKGIRLIANPLGRPPAVPIHVSPGERYPAEGKFGQANTGYGLNRVKARLKETGEPWIACIFLVLNLIKLAGVALPRLISNTVMSFSATGILVWLTSNVGQIRIPMGTALEIMKSDKFNLKRAVCVFQRTLFNHMRILLISQTTSPCQMQQLFIVATLSKGRYFSNLKYSINVKNILRKKE